MRFTTQLPLVTLCLAMNGVLAHAQVLPANWRESPAPVAGEGRVFEAVGLPPGEFAAVRLSPRQALGGQTLQQFTATATGADAPPEGSWTGGATVDPKSAGLVTAARPFSRAAGGQGFAIYFAVSRVAGQARLLRVLLSSGSTARGPQGVAAQNLASALMRSELDGTLRDEAPSTAAASTPAATTPAPSPRAFSTPPGAGLRADQIEAVFYHWDQRYDAFQGLVLDEAAYLLLKDGTAHDGFDLPPQDFDAAASRRAEPRNWGRWLREGNSYAFAWPASPTTYRVPRGNPVAPSLAGLRIAGRFAGASTYTLPGGGTSTWSQFSTTFTADGRFEHSVSGGASSSVGDARSSTTYDDDQVVSSSSTNSAVISGSSRRGAGEDRRGSYEIEGYGIVLRYDSGKVERLAFFVDDDGAGVWLRGTRLMREKPRR